MDHAERQDHKAQADQAVLLEAGEKTAHLVQMDRGENKAHREQEGKPDQADSQGLQDLQGDQDQEERQDRLALQDRGVGYKTVALIILYDKINFVTYKF